MTTKRTKANGPAQSGPKCGDGARVVRITDPAGLLPDGIGIRDMDKIGPEQRSQVHSAVHEILGQLDPRSRIARIARHAELAPLADTLLARFEQSGNRVDSALEIDIRGAQARALYLDAAPRATRDRRLQDAKRKPRGSKLPALDAWLDSALTADEAATNEALWNLLPEDDDELCRDGDLVVERRFASAGATQRTIERSTGRDGFDKRVTAARKRRQ